MRILRDNSTQLTFYLLTHIVSETDKEKQIERKEKKGLLKRREQKKGKVEKKRDWRIKNEERKRLGSAYFSQFSSQTFEISPPTKLYGNI